MPMGRYLCLPDWVPKDSDCQAFGAGRILEIAVSPLAGANFKSSQRTSVLDVSTFIGVRLAIVSTTGNRMQIQS